MSLVSNGDIGKYDYSFKMIVIGDAGVGKSSLTNRASKEKFLSDYSPTVGFEFLTFTTNIDNKIIKLQIWDTCGQEVYRSLITNFYRNASLSMMVYAINNRESFLHINQWLKEVRVQSHPDVKILLIGNKADLENERAVTKDEAEKFKEENQILYFEETSAKTGLNAKEVFAEAARLLYNEHKNYRLRSTKKKSNNLQSRAKLFITKEKKSVKQIKPKYNKNKNNTLYKFKKSFEKLKLTIYKYHIYNYFIILKNKLLTPKHDAFYNKAIFNRKVYSAEINPRKKHIKIKYIKKKSKSTEKCDCSLSCKTSSSNSKSTLNTTKKMKVYKRTVFINAHNNNENKISELDDKIRNQFKLRLTNILFKICSDERKYFIKWKKQCVNVNN